MYDDHDSNVDELGYQTVERFPFMTLYGYEESRSRILENRARMELTGLQRETIGPTGSPSQIYRVMRFFMSIEGFHTGCLDLTGRHIHRFVDLSTRWNLYLVDFLALTVHVKEFNTDETTLDGSLIIDYAFDDHTLWENFKKKWKVPPPHTYGTLLPMTQRVLSTISRYPVPRIQERCLVHLPPEILDHIFQMSSLNQTRLLSSTCKYLNDIGHRHAYKKRTITFHLPWDVFFELRKSDHPTEYLKHLARSSREKVLSKTTFLLGRPDLMNKIEDLSICDMWAPALFENFLEGGFDLWTIEDGFYIPIYTAFATILSSSQDVTTLVLQGILLTPDIIRAVAEICRLQTVELRRCRFRTSTCTWMRANDGVPVWNFVHNLHLVPTSSTLWYSALLCPHLRTLVAEGACNVPPPSLVVALRFQFLPTLGHLYLANVLPIHVLSFARALLARANVTMGKLTHVKFHSADGFSDDSAITLLDALSQRESPLQVLVLDGLAEARFRLFDHISRQFPNLVGLTMIRRASNRQVEDKPAVWPHGAWEYASHLSGLDRLQHFGWNYKSHLIPSSAPLLRFEEGFRSPETDLDEWFKAHEDDSEEADKWTPAVFAAHCPSLRTYTSSVNLVDWCISRTPDASIVVEPPMNGQNTYSAMMRWNPSGMARHWPRILRDRATEAGQSVG